MLEKSFNLRDEICNDIVHVGNVLGSLMCLRDSLSKLNNTCSYELSALDCAITFLSNVYDNIDKNFDDLWEILKND